MAAAGLTRGVEAVWQSQQLGAAACVCVRRLLVGIVVGGLVGSGVVARIQSRTAQVPRIARHTCVRIAVALEGSLPWSIFIFIYGQSKIYI